MLREDCRVGMPVCFGRENGEKTNGIVEKCNRVKAVVKITEQRGTGRGSEVGSRWTVDYRALTPTNPADAAKVLEAAQAIPAPAARVLKYSPFSQDNLILEALVGVYSGLEPEALTCDGEASAAHIRQRRTELNRKAKGLIYALGYEVSESEAFNWYREKQEAQQARQRETQARNGLPEGHPNAVQNWNGQY